MCGIFGYIGHRSAGPLLLEGLQRLEYRGYDSAGLAVISPQGELVLRKSVGKLSTLTTALQESMPGGTVGFGHTRWATHGPPSLDNAHPHLDCTGSLAVIHNGIVENYRELRKELEAQGHTFTSVTDTEVIPHLIEAYRTQGASFPEAVSQAARRLEGAFAFMVLCRQEPEQIVVLRVGYAGGIVIGYGEGEMFAASDLPALLPLTRQVVFLAPGEMAMVTRQSASYCSLQGQTLTKTPRTVPYDVVSVAKRGYAHFMLKEIWEQPEALTDTLRDRLSFEPPDVLLEEIPFSQAEIEEIRRLVLVGCGTSLHAALAGKFMLEELTRLPVEVDYSSEFRYRQPPIGKDTLCIAISQSGETVDTLAAMEEARRRHAKLLAICNVEGSQATHLAEGTLLTRLGPEVGVASTKTFTGQLVALYLLAAYLGKRKGVLSPQRVDTLINALAHLPRLLGRLLEQEHRYSLLARLFYPYSDFLYLGRGIQYPVALEGALKLKEISYIHAEGYPAAEMKHGPIALIDSHMPVVVIAPKDRLYEKTLGNIEEVKARGGIVIALASEGDNSLAEKVDHIIYVPETEPLLSPVLTVIPLQLLAYHIAVRRGCDVDQPRNLAKTVTVE